jgi:hypothetical protein
MSHQAITNPKLTTNPHAWESNDPTFTKKNGEVTVNNGKQYASLDARIEKRGEDYTVELKERGVEAFRGQQIAAGAATATAATAAKAAAGVLVAPAAAALGGAAIGAIVAP